MKTIFTILLGLSASAFAENAKVEITSFRYADARGRIAELCGKITGDATAPIFVKALIDEQSNGPAIYNILVGPEKKFCSTVVTYWGTASASLWGASPAPMIKLSSREERQ